MLPTGLSWLRGWQKVGSLGWQTSFTRCAEIRRILRISNVMAGTSPARISLN
jgi:hypothetical protein